MKQGKLLVLLCFLLAFTTIAFAQADSENPTYPDPRTDWDADLAKIQSTKAFQNIMTFYKDPVNSKERFKEHMELVRISSPSRQEVYRAMEIAKRFSEAGFTKDEIVFNVSGVMPGAAIQLIDDLPVWNTCAIIKGSTPDSVVNAKNGIYSRPKVVIEGHIDSVNPPSIDISDKSKIPAAIYDKIRIAPMSEALVSSPDELKAITMTLNFDKNNKLIEDDNFKKAYRRFANADEAMKNGAYRIYIPGYSDAMGNTTNVYIMAKLFKKYKIQPVHDIWFCATSGEEGRGNLAGMKQLYGYNQQADASDNAMKGKNTLNIVANLSIDGGNLSIHYLGSYRYEVNYAAEGKANAAMAAARAIDGIAKIKAPHEKDSSKPKTTYTVGMIYPAEGDGSKNTSFEIDMRSPVPGTLLEIRDEILPWYPKGAELETKATGSKVVQTVKWFGDRPAHRRSVEDMKKDPLIYAGWKAYEITGMAKFSKNPSETKMVLPKYPQQSTSLNDNIPAALNIPSVNLNIAATAAGGGGHTFFEWGVPGLVEQEAANFERVMLTLLFVSGVHGDDGKVLIKPAYGDKAPRHVNVATDNWLK